MTKDRGVFLRHSVLSACWLAASLAILCSTAIAQEVIVNPDVADRSVSQSTLRAIFSMHVRQWPNGKPVKVFVLPDEDPVHISFTKGVLHTFPHQLRRSWDLLVYSGSGQAPTVVTSPKEMRQKVLSTPGAIGYLPEEYMIKGGNKNENVLIMQVR